VNSSSQYSSERLGRQHLLALLFYIILMVLAFSSRWVMGETMFFEVIWDPIPLYLFYPGDEVSIDTFRAGQLPLWDPFHGFGNSLVSWTWPSVFYPLKVMAFILDSLAGWEFYLLLRFLMAGFFTYLFARTLKMGFGAATLCGLAFMLCGYFREFHSFININIEALFPLEMLILLKLAKRVSLTWFLACILVGAWLVTGYQPEITFFAFGYCFAFFVFASLVLNTPFPQGLKPFLVRLTIILVGLILIHLLSGYGLLPFIEYLGLCWNYHFPGIEKIHVPMNHLLALVTPVFDYWIPPSASHVPERLHQFTLLPAYLGWMVSSLAILAFVHLRRLPAIMLFFVIAIFFYFGMTFYLPGFSLVNHLPLFNKMQNFRYAQPYLAFSTAILAGFSLDMIARKKLSLPLLFSPFAVILIWIMGEAWLFRHVLLHSGLFWHALFLSGIALVITGALVLIGWKLSWLRSRSRLISGAVIILAASELFIYFVLAVPLYGDKAFRVYPVPPAVEFLKSRAGIFRVYSLEPYLLHPNLGGVYRVPEIREQAPLYPKDYVNFFSAVNGWKNDSERVGHFLEKGRFYFDLDLNRAPAGLINLINLRYVLSPSPLGDVPLPQAVSLESILAPHPHFFSRAKTEINSRSRDSMFLHAPARIELKINPIHAKALHLDAGIMENAWGAEGFDGACLSALARTETASRLVFFRFLDPGARSGERCWLEMNTVIPFSDFSDEAFCLALASTPGPHGNPENDYALFGDIGLIGEDILPAFRMIYDQDCRIYENTSALPRAFWVPKAEYFPDMEQVLERMLDDNFDPLESVLLQGKDREGENPGARGELNIEEYEFGRVRIRVSSDSAGWLVLSDKWFPGWRAELDGEESRIRRAYFLFRAVHVPAGDHELVFRYYPWPTRIGIWLSIIGILTILLILFLKRIRRFILTDKAPG